MTPADPQLTKSCLLMEKSGVSTHTGQLLGDIVYTIHVGIKKKQDIGKRQSVFHEHCHHQNEFFIKMVNDVNVFLFLFCSLISFSFLGETFLSL